MLGNRSELGNTRRPGVSLKRDGRTWFCPSVGVRRDDVSTLFQSIDEIRKLICAGNDIVIFRIDRDRGFQNFASTHLPMETCFYLAIERISLQVQIFFGENKEVTFAFLSRN